MHNQGRKIRITRDALSYEHGKTRFTVRWQMLAFSAPARTKKTMRVLSISDGKNLVRIEEIFFPDFDNIVKHVSEAKSSKPSELRL